MTQPFCAARTRFDSDGTMASEVNQLIDEYAVHVPPLRQFILPGGNSLSSQMHFARAICR